LKDKNIKKLSKILLIVLLVLISIPSLGILFLQNNKIQTYLAKELAVILSENLHAKITLEAVTLTFINRLQLKNLYIEDQQGDTLLFAGKIRATLRNYNSSKKEIVISHLTLEDSYIHFNVDTSGVLNLQFIIDAVKNDEQKDSSRSVFQIINAELKNCRFHLTSEGKDFFTKGVNYSDMDMLDLNCKVNNFEIRGDTVAFSARKLSLHEKSGFIIKELSTEMSLSGRHMDFEHFKLNTPNSQIFAKYLKLSFFDFADFSDFVNLVGINFTFDQSLVSFGDISYFASDLMPYDESFIFSGHISGQISNLKGDDLLLAYNNNTRLMANFTMIGLPDVKSAFLNFDIINLETSSADLQMLKIPGENQPNHLKIPGSISELGTINYTGKFTGYFDDFVAYGKFSTSLGEFSSDLLLKPDTANTLYFQGKLKTSDFFLGKLIKKDSIVGRISMNANINGYASKSGLFAKMNGKINSLELNHYAYNNINLAGTIAGKVFDGSFSISDPNIKMDFLGKVNFSNENPEFAFTADVSRARPYYLNISNTDPGYFASFLLETNFTGKTIDQLNGEIRIVNSLFRKKDEQLQIYNFNILAVNSAGNNRISIHSEVMDGEVSGIYKLSTLPSSFMGLASYYLPSLEKKNSEKNLNSDNNNFDFSIKFKNGHPFITFFLPELDLGNNSEISGHYRPLTKDVELNVNTSMLIFKGNEWKDLNIKTSSNRQTVDFMATSTSFVISNKMILDNWAISTQLQKDTAKIAIDWDSKDQPLYQGNINAIANLQRNTISGNPIIGLHFDPSEIFINDTLWNISESNVTVDSSSVSIDSFRIRNQNQNFLVSGILSENSDDALRLSFIDMNLATLNFITNKINIHLAGKLSGQASIKDPFHNFTLLSDLQMDDLFINKEDFGKGEILANWNNSNKKIHIKSFLGRGEIPGLKFEGDYIPQSKKMDFEIDLDKFRLSIFQPWASVLVSDLKGIANGKLTLGGTTEKPDLNGNLRLMKTSMIVDYLQTRYNFSNDVKIAHNTINIKDFEVFDEKGNKAVAQGNIFSNYLKEYKLDIKLESANFAFLNTTEKNNSLFYGRIFAGGIIHVTGPTDDLVMNINAKSQRNSMFYIPLYGTEEVTVRNFIDWVDPVRIEESIVKTEPRYEVKMKGMQLNFNLEVTPEAEVQLIFDPKIGDIIKGRGSGNLKVLINTLGKFEIYGDISIDQGDYLFTLKNVINKRFVVEKGGRISWNGDPIDANIDMQAIYSLKTSISPLDPDVSQSNAHKRIPVECVVNMSGKLMNPTIKPDIKLPGADQTTQNIVKNSINTDEELMKQFVSLLVMNNFYSQQSFNEAGASSGIGVTTTELLSNQVSSWLSQISNDFDIGVNYRPGDQLTSEELQVALSTQILNDRLSISGNIDVGGTETGTTSTTNTNSIVGDFDINFKITENVHVKAFNRLNEDLFFEGSPYIQGVGLMYRDYFNDFRELSTRLKKPFIRLFSGKKPDEEEKKEIDEQ
jgi:hypothetical protein